MKKLSITCILVIFSITLWATQTASFQELNKPGYMLVDGDYIYVSQAHNIFIYSKQDYKLLKSFGQDGEGPGEFKIIPTLNRGSVWLSVTADHLIASSMGRVSLFSRDGEYIREFKVTSLAGWYTGFSAGFAGSNMVPDAEGTYIVLNKYSSAGEPADEIFKMKIAEQDQKFNPVMITRFPLLHSYKGKLFMDGFITGHSGEINVFNGNGELSKTITPAIKIKKFTARDRERVINWYRTNPRLKEGFDILKNLFVFPDHYPLIRSYNVEDDSIYVITYHRRDGKSECLILDLNGDLQKRVWIDLADMDELEIAPYDIHNRKLYQLIENEQSETWELHISTLW